MDSDAIDRDSASCQWNVIDGKSGFTIIEVLVSIGVIAILVALLLPAVQAARGSARTISCSNHLKQIALAMHNYESVHSRFPATFFTSAEQNARGNGASWSVHGRLLPFLEQEVAHQRIELDRDWHQQVRSGVTALQIPTYLCPSEPNHRIRLKDGKPYVAPQTYGANFGTWLIYDPTMEATGDGALVVNRGISSAGFRDGLSNTLAFAEVKAYQPYLRNTAPPATTPPTNPTELAGLGGQFKRTGHTVWPDGRVHHSGFTTTFPPNYQVLYRHAGRDWDIDFSSQQEGKNDQRTTYAAITSRSYHPGRVNVSLMDGSVRSVSESIERRIWRALGTRSGSEVFKSF